MHGSDTTAVAVEVLSNKGDFDGATGYDSPAFYVFASNMATSKLAGYMTSAMSTRRNG